MWHTYGQKDTILYLDMHRWVLDIIDLFHIGVDTNWMSLTSPVIDVDEYLVPAECHISTPFGQAWMSI